MKSRTAPSALLVALLALPLGALGGCQQLGFAPAEIDETAVRETEGPRPNAHVVVQHVLLAHDDAGIAGVTRSLDQARALAETVLAKAQAGEDFGQLVMLYGDDRGNAGVLAIANFGAATETAQEIERVKLARGFGDLAFQLQPGEFGVVSYDPARSPFGFHVITRLR